MKELDELFDIWEKRHRDAGHKRFIRDGIVDEKWWFEKQSVPKICFFLKEARTKEEKYNLTNDLREKEPWRLWQRVAVWTQAIQMAFSGERAYDEEKIKLKSHDAVKQIAVVNVKKSDGMPESKGDDLWKYVNDDKDLLKKELEIINPDIIVCGYTLELLEAVLDAKGNEKNANPDIRFEKIRDTMYGFWKDKLVIDYYHPACHYPNRVNYYALMSICRMAEQEWEERKFEYARKADSNIRTE